MPKNVLFLQVLMTRQATKAVQDDADPGVRRATGVRRHRPVPQWSRRYRPLTPIQF